MTTIIIQAELGDAYEVEAHVFGDWAAHACHRGGQSWCVTHVPSGRRVRSELVLTEKMAVAVANALDLEAPRLPEILPSDPDPQVPDEAAEAINAVFARVLKSRRKSRPSIAKKPSSDDVVSRGER